MFLAFSSLALCVADVHALLLTFCSRPTCCAGSILGIVFRKMIVRLCGGVCAGADARDCVRWSVGHPCICVGVALISLPVSIVALAQLFGFVIRVF